jgi:uroporphyrinogen decarboxylase
VEGIEMSWRDKVVDKEIDLLAEKIRAKIESEGVTPLQRFYSLVGKEPPNRMPVFFPLYVEWAAHYLGYKLNRDFAFDGKKWAHAALASVDRFECDLCAPLYDIYNIGPEEMGSEVIYPEDALPEICKPAVNTPEDLKNLTIPDPLKEGRMSVVLDAIKISAAKIGDVVPVFVSINGPFSWAANLRGIYNYVADMKRNPKFAHELLEIVTDAAIKYLKPAMDLKMGPVFLADAAATEYLLSPKQIDEYVLWSYRKVQEAVGRENFLPFIFGLETQEKIIKEGIGLPLFGFSNYANTEGSGREPLSSFEDLLLRQKAKAKEYGVLNFVAIWGQWLQVHSPKEIDEEVKKLIEMAGPDWPFVVGLNHLPLGTPIENIDAFVNALKTYGKFK